MGRLCPHEEPRRTISESAGIHLLRKVRITLQRINEEGSACKNMSFTKERERAGPLPISPVLHGQQSALKQRAILTSRIQRTERVKAPKRVEDAAQLVRLFIQDFRTTCGHLPVEIPKLVVHKCGFGIDVDPDGHYAGVYVRTIPAVTPEIEKALNLDESKALIATAACARNRKNPHCETFRGEGTASIIETSAVRIQRVRMQTAGRSFPKIDRNEPAYVTFQGKGGLAMGPLSFLSSHHHPYQFL